MEQLSFASVYRTAAILAAFSHASAAGEPMDGRAPWPEEHERPIASAIRRDVGRSFFDICAGFLPRWWVPRLGHSFRIEDVTQTNGRNPRESSESWSRMGPHRPCVTSHFAFADDGDGGGSRS